MTSPDHTRSGRPGIYLIALHVDRLLLSVYMKVLVPLRVVAGLHAVAICLQPVLAGAYLNGAGPALRMHEPLGLSLAGIGLLQLLIATAWWRTGGRGIAPVVALLILAGEVLQIAMGYSRQLAVHIPLGVALVAGTVAFAVWINRRPAQVPA